MALGYNLEVIEITSTIQHKLVQCIGPQRIVIDHLGHTINTAAEIQLLLAVEKFQIPPETIIRDALADLHQVSVLALLIGAEAVGKGVILAVIGTVTFQTHHHPVRMGYTLEVGITLIKQVVIAITGKTL